MMMNVRKKLPGMHQRNGSKEKNAMRIIVNATPEPTRPMPEMDTYMSVERLAGRAKHSGSVIP